MAINRIFVGVSHILWWLIEIHHHDGPKFVYTDEMELFVDKLVKLLPAVTREQKNGRLEEWVSFFTLVNKRDFNLDNIATQLFLAVVKFTDSHYIPWNLQMMSNIFGQQDINYSIANLYGLWEATKIKDF